MTATLDTTPSITALIGSVPVRTWPGITVTVSAPPAGWNWPAGTLACLARRDRDGAPASAPDPVTGPWTLCVSVTRYRAAMALSLATDIHPDMTPAEIGAAILAVFDQGHEATVQHGVSVADAADRRRAFGVRATPGQRREYRACWPDKARTTLCLRLADRLLACAAQTALAAADPRAASSRWWGC